MRPDSPLAHAKHILRAGLLLVAVAVVLVLGRSFFVPPSWGEYGRYRGDNVAQQRAIPPRHGGNAACRECHEDETTELLAGAHAKLACEGCHAPLASHASGDELLAEMPVRKDAELCLGCHRQLDARPAGHPQINERAHLAEQEVEPAPDVCFDCHAPHSPL